MIHAARSIAENKYGYAFVDKQRRTEAALFMS